MEIELLEANKINKDKCNKLIELIESMYDNPLFVGIREEQKEEIRQPILTEIKKLISSFKDHKSKINICVDKKGLTPLHLAVKNQNKDLLEMLLDTGADVNIKSTTGLTPLHLAAINRNEELSKMLLDKGSNVNIQSTTDGSTPFMLAVTYAADNDLSFDYYEKILDFLIDNNANINIKNKWGMSPFYVAMNKRGKNTWHYLLDNGANIKDDMDTNQFTEWEKKEINKYKPNKASSKAETALAQVVHKGILYNPDDEGVGYSDLLEGLNNELDQDYQPPNGGRRKTRKTRKTMKTRKTKKRRKTNPSKKRRKYKKM
jgi:ankyrin repeat protein